MVELGDEIKDVRTLAKIKTVEEMLPRPAENQINKPSPLIGEEQYRVLEECFHLDSTVENACMAAGISVSAYYKHRDKNPDFARRMDIAKEFPKMSARAAVMKRILQGDAKTALRYLELRDKRYGTDVPEEGGSQKTKVEFTLVPTIEGADQIRKDTQMSTKQNSASDGYSNSGEVEKSTPWENEDEVLGNIGG